MITTHGKLVSFSYVTLITLAAS